MDNEIPEKTKNERSFTVSFLQKLEIVEKTDHSLHYYKFLLYNETSSSDQISPLNKC